MLQNGCEFGGLQPHVERHDDGVHQRHAVIAFEELAGVEAEIGHAVAAADTLGDEAGREPFASFAELRIGIPAIAGDDANLAAVQVHAAIQAPHRCQRYVHSPSPESAGAAAIPSTKLYASVPLEAQPP